MKCPYCQCDVAPGVSNCPSCGANIAGNAKSPSAGLSLDMILKNKRNICLAGCALMAIAVFFNFASASAYGYTVKTGAYIKGDGVIVLIAAIAAAALIWFQKEKLSFIGTGIALATTLYDMSQAPSGASFGASPWLIIIGAIVAAGPLVMEIVKAKQANK